MLLLSSACSEGWNLYFEAIFVSCFFPSSTLLQTIEAADHLLFLSTISTVTVTSSIDPHFWHFLSCLLRLTHVDVNSVVKGKGERVSEGKAFTPVLAPRGEVSFYHWTSCGAQKSVKRVSKECQKAAKTHTHTGTHIQVHTKEHKMENTAAATVEIHTDKIMHKHKRHSRGNTLIVYSHIGLLHPAVFFSFIQTMRPLHSPITTTNHKCKPRGHVRKDNGKSKLNLLFVLICAATWSSEVVLLLILQ